jgi:hypothetical protein
MPRGISHSMMTCSKNLSKHLKFCHLNEWKSFWIFEHNMTFQMAIMYVIHTSFARITLFNYNTFGNVLGFQILIHWVIQNTLWFPTPKVIAHWRSLAKLSSCTFHALPFHLEGMCLESCPYLTFSFTLISFYRFYIIIII